MKAVLLSDKGWSVAQTFPGFARGSTCQTVRPPHLMNNLNECKETQKLKSENDGLSSKWNALQTPELVAR
jgi:hypothetical protein